MEQTIRILKSISIRLKFQNLGLVAVNCRVLSVLNGLTILKIVMMFGNFVLRIAHGLGLI